MNRLPELLTDKDIAKEKRQVIVRTIIAAIFFFTLLFYHNIFEPENTHTKLVINISLYYLLISGAYAVWTITSRNKPVLRRYLILIIDTAFLSAITYIYGTNGFAIYPLMLWISISYGISYGFTFHFFSSIFTFAGFNAALMLSGAWFIHPQISFALMLGQLLLPSLFNLSIKSIQDLNKQYLNEIERNDHLLTHNPLTDLPNRKLIEPILCKEIAAASREGATISVAYLDVNDFNEINDTLGYEAGDQLIISIAENLKRHLRTTDHLAHLGSDEFLIILKNESTNSGDYYAIERLFNYIAGEYRIDDHELYINFSVGISRYPDDAVTPEALIINANTALSGSKKEGGSTICYYDAKMSTAISRNLSIQKELRSALQKQQFYVLYQPQLSMVTGKITGVEALIRWRHPEFGLIPPDHFIPIAERSGLIDEIGEWVLLEAIKQNKAWQNAGLQPITIAVNLSAHQLHSPLLVRTVTNALNKYNLDPGYLELEVTESMLLERTEQAINTLKTVRALGVNLAMDDFGTGYSSLAYLQKFPFNKLKIDKSFVSNITTDPEQAAIINTIISMGHNLNMSVLAEGVETTDQASYLRRHNCNQMQGYLLSKPVDSESISHILQNTTIPEWVVSHHQINAKPSILIVDDEKISLLALSSIFDEKEFSIYTSSNVNDAFTILANHTIDVVICDNRMPEMLGLDFLSHIKSLYPETIRILVTAQTDAETAQSAVNSGAVYKFFSKDIQSEVLTTIVNDAITQKQLNYLH